MRENESLLIETQNNSIKTNCYKATIDKTQQKASVSDVGREKK